MDRESEMDQWLANEIRLAENERVLAAGQVLIHIERLLMLLHEPVSQDRETSLATLTLNLRTTLRSIGQTFQFVDDGPVVDVPGAVGMTECGGFREGVRITLDAFRCFMAERMRSDGVAADQSTRGLVEFRLAMKHLKSFLIISEAVKAKTTYEEAAYRLQVRRDEVTVDRSSCEIDTPVETGSDSATDMSSAETNVTRRKTPAVNTRMLGKMTADPNTVSWTAEKWGDHLGVTPAAIKQTQAWRTLMKLREQEKLVRASR